MKIICIGRNYKDHIKELNNEIPESPVIFLKPDTSLLNKNKPFFIPSFSNKIEYEVEVLIRINRIGKHIKENFAHKYYNEVGLGVDFTARDIQNALKTKGLPWEKSKGFDNSALVGEWLSKKNLPSLNELNFRLEKNGKIVQSGFTKDMIWNIDQLIVEISKFFTLKIGDIIFTGTPSGVGIIEVNDGLKGYLEDSLIFSIKIK